MSLRENLSRLSPNEFLEKMQDMFQMYQESQDDYYEEDYKENIKKMKEQEELSQSKGITNYKSDKEFYQKSVFSKVTIESLKKLQELITRIIANSKSNDKVSLLFDDAYKKLARIKVDFGGSMRKKVENLADLLYVLRRTMDKFPGIKV